MNTIIFIFFILGAILATYLICDIKYRSLLAKYNGLKSQFNTVQQQNERFLAEKLAEKVPSYVKTIQKKEPPRPNLPDLKPMDAHESYKFYKQQKKMERKK